MLAQKNIIHGSYRRRGVPNEPEKPGASTPQSGGNPPVVFIPSWKFNDAGGAGGGDRNSMYLAFI